MTLHTRTGLATDATSRSGEPYVDPDVAALLAAADPEAQDFWQMTPGEARTAMDAMVEACCPRWRWLRSLTARSLRGDHVLPARLYRPATQPGPLLLFFHGGGWEVGELEMYDRPLRRLAVDSGVSVL